MSVLNRLINNLPFEAHIPGYSFCGPGTKLEKRLKRGDPGKNGLDKACRDHDVAYSQNTDLKERHLADQKLANQAWERVKSKDSSVGEKIAAWGVTNAMKAKVKMGMGICNRTKRIRKRKHEVGQGVKNPIIKSFQSLIANTRQAVNQSKPLSVNDTIHIALKTAKKIKKKKNIKIPRVIPINYKIGGFLPLIPIFAGLSALGALSGGAAGIASAINKAKIAQQELAEMKKHNRLIESVTIGKGLYLGPYKKGSGLYIKPWSK